MQLIELVAETMIIAACSTHANKQGCVFYPRQQAGMRVLPTRTSRDTSPKGPPGEQAGLLILPLDTVRG